MSPKGRNIVFKIVPFLILVILVSSIPMYSTAYVISLFFFLLTYIALAIAYDIFGGYSGYFNLGFGAFFALGAYMFAMLTVGTLGLKFPPVINIIIAIATTGVLAFVLSYPFFRLRGAYFAIATFSLVPLLSNLARNLKEQMGGASGLQILGEEIAGYKYGYYIAIVLVLIAMLVHYSVSKSRIGLALNALRDDEDVAAEYGINTFRIKQIVFTISAMLGGAIGANFALTLQSISPALVLNLELVFAPVIMSLFGGPGTLLGPTLGAVIILLMQELLWINVPFFHLTVYGFIILVVVIIAPNGIVNLSVFRRLTYRIRMLT